MQMLLEAPGIKAVFLDQAQVIDYATGRAYIRSRGNSRAGFEPEDIERAIPGSTKLIGSCDCASQMPKMI